MKRLLTAIIPAASLALAPAKDTEPREYGPQAVEASPEYQAAVLTKLTGQAVPPGQVMVVLPPPPPPEIPRERLERMEAEFRAISLGFRYDTTSKPLEIAGDGHTLTFHDSKALFMSVSFDPEDRPLSVYISGEQLPLGGNRMITAEKFEAYAIKCHRLAFGGKPQGELDLDEISTGPDGISGNVDAIWSARPGGIPMVSFASLRINTGGLGWSLSLTRGPKAREVADLAELLEKHPTRISEAQAAAIAWKNWKAVRPALYESGEYRIWPTLREIATAEFEPWSGTSHSDKNVRQAWLPAEPPDQPLDPVAYEVAIADGLFKVSVLVDRSDGKILRLNQHRMSW